jgi:nitrous oxidase accessory protein NosD
MNQPKLNFGFRMITVIAIGVFGCSIASAQADRTWVSPSGDDANNCSVTKPCRTFAGALAKTNSGGQIVVKNSGGFGSVTIDRSITIDGAGKYAAIQAPANENGITIQVNGSDIVVLRGLTIIGRATSKSGVEAGIPFAALHVESCVIRGFPLAGIHLFAKASFIEDTVVSESGKGIDLESGSATIERCRLTNNSTGLFLFTAGSAAVRDTIASGNTSAGFEVDEGILNLETCAAANNGTGVFSINASSTSDCVVVVSNSIVTNNQNFGFRQGSPSLFFSRGNNTVFGNGVNTSGTITPLGGT